MSIEIGESWERFNESKNADTQRRYEEYQLDVEVRERASRAATFAKEILERIGYTVPKDPIHSIEHTMQSGYIPLGKLPEVNDRPETDAFVTLNVTFTEERRETEKTRKGWFFTHTYTEIERVPNFDKPSGIEVNYFAGTEDKQSMTVFAYNHWSITSYMDIAGITAVETDLNYLNQITQSLDMTSRN